MSTPDISRPKLILPAHLYPPELWTRIPEFHLMSLLGPLSLKFKTRAWSSQIPQLLLLSAAAPSCLLLPNHTPPSVSSSHCTWSKENRPTYKPSWPGPCQSPSLSNAATPCFKCTPSPSCARTVACAVLKAWGVMPFSDVLGSSRGTQPCSPYRPHPLLIFLHALQYPSLFHI